MHRIFRVKAYEKEHGPHFNEEYARKAVMKMENEDGTRGPHWSLEETTTLASQYGIALGSKFNRYDWFVALNMVYSDYYRVIMNITGSNNTKHYVEFAKAWLNDKDIDEGKMWYYYIYVMCDHIREAEMECYEEKMSKYEDEEEDFGHYRRGGRRMGMFGRRSMYDKDDYEKRDYERVEHEYDPLPNQPRKKVVDVTIQCNGESRKFTIPENKSVITDTNLGLTISTDKQEIVNILRNQYNTYKARKESIAKCDEEMSKCQALLEKLDIPKEPTNTEDPRIKELQDEVNELKNIIKQASSMVPPPMKQMLPQNMQNVMKEVDQ